MSWRGRQLKRPRIRAGGFYFSRGFAARSRALRARISRLRRSCARLDKTAMLRRLRRKERLSCVKLNQAFLIDSWRRTFHVVYSMYKVRLMKSLVSWVVSITSFLPTSYVSSDPNTPAKSGEFLWVGAGSTLVLRLYFLLEGLNGVVAFRVIG